MKLKIMSSLLLFMLAVTAHAADQQAIDAAKSISKKVSTKIATDKAFQENIASPLTAGGKDGVLMKTYDGKNSFAANVSAKSSTVFLEVLAQPGSGGDIGIVKVWQDTDFDNTKDYNYDVPFNVSGICANGLISCRPGTWSECKYYGWSTDASGKVSTSEQTSMNQLGGCYCVNNSCGAGLSWSNIEVILKDLGAAVVGAIQNKKPEFTVTEVAIDSPVIKYYGRASQVQYVNEKGEEIGDQSPTQASLAIMPSTVSPLDSSAQDQQAAAQAASSEALESEGSEQMLNQSGDPSSHYLMFSNLLDESETMAEQHSCSVRREIIHNIEQQACEVTKITNPSIINHNSNGVAAINAASATQFRLIDRIGTGSIISLSNVMFETAYINPQPTAKGINTVVATYNAGENSTVLAGYTASYTCNRLDVGTTNSEAYKIFELKVYNAQVKLYNAGGAEVSSITGLANNSGTWDCGASTGWTSYWNKSISSSDSIEIYNAGTLLGKIVFVAAPICPIDASIGCDQSNPPQCRKDHGSNDIINNSCQAFENDSTCKVIYEKVDGVTLIDASRSTGLLPESSCRTYTTSMGLKQECRDWWLKNRKYHCQVEREKYTFDELGERAASVHSTIDAKGSFIDKRMINGQMTNQSMSVNVQSVDVGVGNCKRVCKTKSPVKNTSSSLATNSTDYQRSPLTYKTHYRECGTTNVCPLQQPGEQVVKGCQCLNEYAEATTILSMMETAGNDMICSKTAPR